MRQVLADDRLLQERIKALCSPMTPRFTGWEASLPDLSEIDAVVFDIYGTLLISSSGDVGVADILNHHQALESALQCAGFGGDVCAMAGQGMALYHEVIAEHHALSRAQGVDYPEVDIEQVWQDVLRRWPGRSAHNQVNNEQIRRLAVEYECRANPVWLMPGVAAMLQRLQCQGMVAGIISNAQFYTPLVLRVLLASSLRQCGFMPDLRVWSFQEGRAKPSIHLFHKMKELLKGRHSVPAHRVLYIGNDERKDISPALEAGFQVALFAGDQRSLRIGETQPKRYFPFVVTDWRSFAPE